MYRDQNKKINNKIENTKINMKKFQTEEKILDQKNFIMSKKNYYNYNSNPSYKNSSKDCDFSHFFFL